MATLILIKQKGLGPDDLFRGTFVGPGDPIAEWDYLTRDSKLRDRVAFKVIEVRDLTALPDQYQSRVKKTPYLAMTGLVSNSNLDYPTTSPLLANNIRDWMIENLDRHSPLDSPIEDEIQTIMDEIPTAAETSRAPANSNRETIQPPPTKVVIQEEDHPNVAVAVGGGMILAGLAVLGAVLGSILADNVEENDAQESKDLCLLDGDGKPTKFHEIDWSKPRPPT